METAARINTVQQPKSVAQPAANGRAMPAIPVLQQLPKEQGEEPMLQMMAMPRSDVSKFSPPATPALPRNNFTTTQFVLQKAKLPDEELPAQGKFIPTAQLKENDPAAELTRYNPIQKKANNTGLPDNLKSGIENLGGYDMSDVKVHYNSPKPAQLQAHAYAQGSDIHIAPGQELHLPHEAWHVVQQKQGRVKATMQMKGEDQTVAQRFRNSEGVEIDVDSLTPDQIQVYLHDPRLRPKAILELKSAARRFFKNGIDGDDARHKRQEFTFRNRKKKSEKVIEIVRLGGKVINGEPAIEFVGEDENHTLFVQQNGGTPIPMIASYPLPVAAFIAELEQRFISLENEYNLNRIKKLRGFDNLKIEFTTAKTNANGELLATNAVFAIGTSTSADKLSSERDLSIALEQLIAKVYAFARRLGTHFNNIGNSKAGSVPFDHYTKVMSGAHERYNIEGMVATYETQPDYQGSGFERDHQPHNDIIETVAALPDFAGKAVQNVAAGRTQKGWSILLHHNRHAAGRTFGALGGQVTTAFNTAWNNDGKGLGTPDLRRKWVITKLKESLAADVAAMKNVANDNANYDDINGLPVDAPTKAALVGKVKAQIIAGEDRITETAAQIDTWDQ